MQNQGGGKPSPDENRRGASLGGEE
jgi:hypothetical protein